MAPVHPQPPADGFDRPLFVGAPNIGDRAAFDGYVEQIFTSHRLSNGGPLVLELEQRIAERLGVRHVVAVSNATLGLQIAAKALNLTGEVIVPSFTFIATANALAWIGIRPVFADIDPLTHCLDPASVRRAITPATSGVLGVHLWGRPAPIEQLQQVADEHGLSLFFDAAHAFGASHGGRMLGSFGRAEVFSFHATKFFNTFEGGAITTDDDDLAELMRGMRNFGICAEDQTNMLGVNAKMSEIGAAMGLVNLNMIDDVVAVNRANWQAYRDALARVPDVRLLTPSAEEANNYQYVVLEIEDGAPGARDQVLHALRERNVMARKYFAPGCHRMSPYLEQDPDAGHRLPGTEEVAARVLVLPTGTAVTPDVARAVVAIIDRVMTTRESDRRLAAVPEPAPGTAGRASAGTRPSPASAGSRPTPATVAAMTASRRTALAAARGER